MRMEFATRRRLALCAIGLGFAALLLAIGVHRAAASFRGANGKIAFTSDRSGSYEIYTIDTDGSGLTQLTTDGVNQSPSWSASGLKIAFASNRDGNFEIYTMNADGSNQTRITNNPALDYQPTWSSDGTKIAFVSDRDGSGVQHIYVMNADGSNVTQLTNASVNDNAPSWSPDGQKIIFHRGDGCPTNCQVHIYSIDADGSGGLTQLTNVYSFDADWSPDGSEIVYTQSGTGLMVMNADGSNPTQLTSDNGYADNGGKWSPDGSKIVFYSNRPNGGLYVMDANGSNQTLLFSGGLWASWQPQPLNVVTNTNDSGTGSLRAAIDYANANPGTTINFAIPTSDPNFNGKWFTITPTTPGGEPPLTADGTTIDGGSEAAFLGGKTNPDGPQIEINGSQLSFGAGLNLQSSNDRINALVVDGFAQPQMDGIHVSGTGDVVTGCFLGVDPTGVASGANYQGLGIDGSANRIGGTGTGDGNVISGNIFLGVHIFGSSNVLEGNFIGLTSDGKSELANGGEGVSIDNAFGPASGNVIGTPAAGNVISGNTQAGIAVSNFSNPSQQIVGTVIQGNLIGTNAGGDTAIPNAEKGVQLSGATQTLVGGTSAGARNVISGNTNNGIVIGPEPGSDNNTVEGNYIGTDSSGAAAVPNTQTGVIVNGTGNTIGGSDPSARNVISGNGRVGVSLLSDSNVVQGNYIGTNAAGTAAVANGDGIAGAGGLGLQSSNDTVVGNVISGNNTTGIAVGPLPGGTVTSDVVQGNLIGTNAAGMDSVPNTGTGVSIYDGTNLTIGGGNSTSRNIVSGNGGDGFDIGGGSTGIAIEGNFVGTDASGTTALRNGGAGVNIGDAQNTNVAANVISGNAAAGVLVVGAAATTIDDNRIGTDAAGTTAVPNGGQGIQVRNYSTGTVIGGPGAGNVISGNVRTGVGIPNANGVVVQGNLIGTDASGTNALPNGGNGVSIGGLSTSASNVIGGAAAGAANTIAFNHTGVAVYSGTGNKISENSIFSNGALGIDLGDDGVTPNDLGDMDSGPNNLQNFPVIRQAVSNSTQLTVSGTIDTPNSQTVTIEIFGNAFPNPGPDPSGYGEGQRFLGTATPASGGKWSVTLPPVPPGTIISATATDANGNTSEFSADAVAK